MAAAATIGPLRVFPTRTHLPPTPHRPQPCAICNVLTKPPHKTALSRHCLASTKCESLLAFRHATCSCGKDDTPFDMIECCAGNKCVGWKMRKGKGPWFHAACVKVLDVGKAPDNWLCPKCVVAKDKAAK